MINTFAAGLLCGWLYVLVVVPMYQADPSLPTKQCTLKIGKTLVQGDAV